jgi:hypothetical protein
MKHKSARRDANLIEFVRNRGHVLAPDALCNIRQLSERKNISVLLDLAKHNTKTCQHEHLQPPPDGSPPVTLGSMHFSSARNGFCPRNALSSLRFCNKTTSHFT